MAIITDTSKRSSNIASVSYEAKTQSLDLTFKSGGRYRYHNVSPLEHQRFMDQPSLGKAFNQMFWGRPKEHPSEKLESTSGH